MKKNIKKCLQSLLLAPVVALGLSMAVPALAGAVPSGCSNSQTAINQGAAGGADCAGSSTQPTSLFGQGGIFKTITNVLLYIIGAVAVIMLIIGGIRYVTSGGDATQVKTAKDTILYAVIGIIVAILAYAIVNFVVGSFATNAGGA